MVEKLKEIIIYNYSMSVMEKISKLSKNGSDDALLNYICDNYDEIECELKVFVSLYYALSNIPQSSSGRFCGRTSFTARKIEKTSRRTCWGS